mmetsp:Transcript_3365/g.10571  ORF Transcript_3365/g.10571 Transcript_3365/m.10571 type:complete len:295 (+) Transcript_3365:819-1703(+)
MGGRGACCSAGSSASTVMSATAPPMTVSAMGLGTAPALPSVAATSSMSDEQSGAQCQRGSDHASAIRSCHCAGLGATTGAAQSAASRQPMSSANRYAVPRSAAMHSASRQPISSASPSRTACSRSVGGTRAARIAASPARPTARKASVATGAYMSSASPCRAYQGMQVPRSADMSAPYPAVATSGSTIATTDSPAASSTGHSSERGMTITLATSATSSARYSTVAVRWRSTSVDRPHRSRKMAVSLTSSPAGGRASSRANALSMPAALSPMCCSAPALVASGMSSAVWYTCPLR